MPMCTTVVCVVLVCFTVVMWHWHVVHGAYSYVVLACASVSEKNLWNAKLFERLGCSRMHVPVLWLTGLQDVTFSYGQVQAGTF